MNLTVEGIGFKNTSKYIFYVDPPIITLLSRYYHVIIGCINANRIFRFRFLKTKGFYFMLPRLLVPRLCWSYDPSCRRQMDLKRGIESILGECGDADDDGGKKSQGGETQWGVTVRSHSEESQWGITVCGSIWITARDNIQKISFGSPTKTELGGDPSIAGVRLLDDGKIKLYLPPPVPCHTSPKGFEEEPGPYWFQPSYQTQCSLRNVKRSREG